MSRTIAASPSDFRYAAAIVFGVCDLGPFGELRRRCSRNGYAGPATLYTGAAMKEFAAKTTIRAEPEAVWAILTDATRYTEWNTTVEKVEGSIAPGETVKLFVKLNPGRAFPVKVSEFEPPSRMVWRGGMPLGLFKGERTFTVSPKAEGEVEFAMREVFSGPMSSLIGRTIPDMGPAFAEFAECLKVRAEAGGG